MKKNIIALLFGITLISGLTGCGAPSPSVPSASETTDTPETTTTVSETTPETTAAETTAAKPDGAGFILIGHSTLEIITGSGKVIYIDPYAKADMTDEADIILVTHQHSDHNAAAIVPQKDNVQIITNKEANLSEEFQTFTIDDVKITAVPAYNKNHKRDQCVGYIIETDGKVLYHAGDTDKIDEMADLAAYNIDYAFLPCDGTYNMNAEGAISCAELIQAKNYVAMHTMFPEGKYSEDVYNAFVAAFGSCVRQGEFVEF